ncbi:ComF family protein [Methylomonas sp. MS20]|uniref:ComF family protein n=1 Tax=unclassified Methylomonas TaxID=2608980 RepID=UPI0028A4B429|nr:ComF family protein [Methylomonas sp. MV1]MDT4331671.1 ComF family protein [Methylomonas sp. MV1]
MVNHWLNIIQTLLLPPRCVLCGAPGHAGLDLCAGCLDDLPRNVSCCYRCGEPFEASQPRPQLCGRCLSKMPAFDETYAPFLYRSHLRYLVSRLKFQRDYKNARVLAGLLAAHAGTQAERPECLIPVPLHRGRYRERGFNQAMEIARHLSNELKIPLDSRSCQRVRDTGHQIALPAKQRRKNLRNAFRATRPLPYRHVAIVDDVMTTGATVAALATALKRAGVGRVDVWVCARA